MPIQPLERQKLEKFLRRPIKSIDVWESHTVIAFPIQTELDCDEVEGIRRRFGNFKISSSSEDGDSWLEIEMSTSAFHAGMEALGRG